MLPGVPKHSSSIVEFRSGEVRVLDTPQVYIIALLKDFTSGYWNDMILLRIGCMGGSRSAHGDQQPKVAKGLGEHRKHSLSLVSALS